MVEVVQMSLKEADRYDVAALAEAQSTQVQNKVEILCNPIGE